MRGLLLLTLGVGAAGLARRAPTAVLRAAPAGGLSRKDALLRGAAMGFGAVLAGAYRPAPALAAGEDTVEVYFGGGCFWHVQHEFVELEKKLLGRQGKQLTSRTGYAGGTSLGKEGRVCYHNMQGIADYGRLGHAEVVGMKIPVDKVEDFANLYFGLFTKYNIPGMDAVYDRVDPMDKGPEYRSLLGLPGGKESPLYAAIERACGDKFKLVAGKGNEPDTLLKKTVYVMDTKAFPFHVAEVYHQFHDDFQSASYGKAYNNLRTDLYDDNILQVTGCPDRY